MWLQRMEWEGNCIQMKKEENLSEKIVEEELKDDEGMICQLKDGVLGIAKTNFIHTEDVKEFIKRCNDKILDLSILEINKDLAVCEVVEKAIEIIKEEAGEKLT